MRAFLPSTIALTLAFAPKAQSQQPVTRTLSRPQFEFPQQFSEVGAIRELRDGRVIVVDARELAVKILDPRLRMATTIGRTGDGPGEYRWPSRLFPLSGDSTLLQDAAGGRLLVIEPDGKPGGFYDPNRAGGDSIIARARRFFVRMGDGRGHLFGESQPIRVGAGGVLELADHAAIERLDVATRERDTVALFPVRKDANARLIAGMGAVVTQPRTQPFPAWEHWAVAPDGRIAFIFFDPYRVDFVGANRRVTQNAPIPYDRVRVDDALKKQYREELERPRMVMRGNRGGASTMEMMKMPFTGPSEWPEFLPPYLGSAMFAPDGLLWIPRATAAGKPPLYDIIDGQGKLFERVQLPPRTKLVGFGANTVYLVRLDEDDLQYLQCHALPTTRRP
ncbi:MAG TPA: hypothetical protein VIK50_08070 [Gemmatimonadaceae bacterium]